MNTEVIGLGAGIIITEEDDELHSVVFWAVMKFHTANDNDADSVG